MKDTPNITSRRCRTAARLATGLLAGWFAGGAASAEELGEVPLLEAEPPRLELGEVFDAQPVRQDVLLHNRGAEAIHLGEVIRSCDACLTVSLSEDVIEPGEVGILTVEFDGLGYDGPVAQWVALPMDHPTGAHLVIPLTATVSPLMRVLRGPLYFADLGRDEERVLEVGLVPMQETGGADLRVVSLHPGFEAELSAPDRHGAYILTVRSAPPQPEIGFVRTRIGLYRGEDREPVYVVPLLAQITPPFHVAPQRLLLEAKDEEQLRILFVRQRTETPARILDVQVPDERFSYEIFLDPSLSNGRINVYSWGLSGASGTIGDVVIETDREKERWVRIPLVVEDRTGAEQKRAEATPRQGSESTCGDEAEQQPVAPGGTYLERAKSLFTP